LIISCGIRGSVSAIVRRSFTARSTRTSPTRKAFSAISPTLLTRRFAEVIDVIDRAVAVSDVDQHLQDVNDVIARQEPEPAPDSRRTRRLNFMRRRPRGRSAPN